MIQVVDIYTKIIIAFLSFIAPTVTLLLPILGEKIGKLRSTYESEEKQLNKIIDDINNPASRQHLIDNVPEEIKVKFGEFLTQDAIANARQFQNKLAGVEKDLHILELKGTIRNVFVLLIISLAFVMLYHLIKVNLYSCFGLALNYHLVVGLLCLLISGILFARAIFFIWRLVRMIIETKTEVSVITAET